MNLALFVTAKNRGELKQFADKAALMQESQVNGAVVVVHPANMSASDVGEIIGSLRPRFKVATSLPCNINLSHKDEVQVAAMFGRFLLNAYARFPGPWMIVDEGCSPTKPDFMDEALTLHKIHGNMMTGRCVRGQGWLVPVGPVVLSAPAQGMRFLRFFANESWRRRGQFHFARIGFGSIPVEDYLFDVSEAQLQVEPTPDPVKREPITRDELPKPMIAVNDDVTSPVVTVEATQEAMAQTPQDTPSEGYKNYSNFDDKELRQFAEQRTGQKIHHFTGRDKVLEILANA